MNPNEQYLKKIYLELENWKAKQVKLPSKMGRWTATAQTKLNSYIPEKVHKGITEVIKPLVQAVLFGSKHTSANALPLETSLIHREALAKSAIEQYAKTGAAEGGITGAGGFLMSVADFPLLIGIKFKLLFDLASFYGMDVKNYKERLYILYVFQLAFSSPKGRIETFKKLKNWEDYSQSLPENQESFDWRTFQQEYRDYIDLAKLAQLLPIIGAAVGAIANFKLINKLGLTAMMCYRMRILETEQRQP